MKDRLIALVTDNLNTLRGVHSMYLANYFKGRIDGYLVVLCVETDMPEDEYTALSKACDDSYMKVVDKLSSTK